MPMMTHHDWYNASKGDPAPARLKRPVHDPYIPRQRSRGDEKGVGQSTGNPGRQRTR